MLFNSRFIVLKVNGLARLYVGSLFTTMEMLSSFNHSCNRKNKNLLKYDSFLKFAFPLSGYIGCWLSGLPAIVDR